MVLYEFEDMFLHKTALVEFDSELQAHKILTGRGYVALDKYECYAGSDKDTGNEICVIKAAGIHYSFVKSVNS